MPRSLLVFLLVAGVLALALVSGGGAPGPARADGLLVSQQVKAQIAKDGRARVIVEVRLPSGAHVPEGELPTQAHVAAQRANLSSAQSQLLARLRGRGHTLLHRFQTVPYLALEVQPDGLQELEASTFYVQRVVEDELNVPMLPQSVPLIGADDAWAAGFDGTGIMVAILDTGVDKTHPFLAGRVVEEACYSSFATSLCPNGQFQQIGAGAGVNCSPSIKGCWHGTHVAGVAAGKGVSYSGVAKGAQIMAVQVFSQASGALMAATSDVMAGLERVYSLHNQYTIASVNLSLGGSPWASPCNGNPLKGLIDNLRSVGIATVIAAGNGGLTTMLSSPSCVSTAVSVSSTEKSDVVSPFSNVASFLSLFAPGGSILSSFPGGTSISASGTSMATPHVTGAWAILKQAAPEASVSAILTALQQTGVPIKDTRLAGFYTKPRIRIAEALATMVPLGPPPPPPPPQTLMVASTNPSSGVVITVSPADTGGLGSGTTQFSRVYSHNALVTLTASATAGNNTFQKWQRDGVDVSTSPSVQVTMDTDHELTAVYVLASFVDVPPSHSFWPWIEALFREGITGGCGANPPLFCPDQSVSRGEMAVFLLRSIHGADYAPPAASGVFADVPPGDQFAAWIEQVFAEGITTGCGTNPLRYCPTQAVTRGEMAVLLLRAKHGSEYQPPAAAGIFADVPPGDPLAAWIEQLFAEGTTAGCGTNPLRYCAGENVTRGQMAVFLVRTFGFPL